MLCLFVTSVTSPPACAPPGLSWPQGYAFRQLSFSFWGCFFISHEGMMVVVVQSLSRVQFFATPWTAAHQDSLFFTVSQSLLRLISIELVMPSVHRILSHPLLLFSILPSIRVFSSELALCIKGAKYWSFSFSIGPSNEYSGLISFRIEWFDLLAVQGTLKSNGLYPSPDGGDRIVREIVWVHLCECGTITLTSR